MKLRCKVRTPKGWKDEKPEDVSKWLWKHDGEEAVCIDDSTHTYYVGTPSMMESYRAAWEKEGKGDDRRKAEPFITLDRQLYDQEVKHGMA